MTDLQQETPLQRETRLTGNQELLSAVDNTLQALLGQKSNMVLARKVVGRWCQSKNPKEFKQKVRDYCGNLDENVLLGFFMTIQRRVEMLGTENKVEELKVQMPEQGGLLQRPNAIVFRSTHSKLGLDKIAKEKRQQREREQGPVTAARLDADPLADLPKPKEWPGPPPGAKDPASDSDSDSAPAARRQKEMRKKRAPPERLTADRSRSRSRSPKASGNTASTAGGRASSAELWDAAKGLREQVRAKEKESRPNAGQPVFFKGNKGVTKPSAAESSEVKKERDKNSDLQYASITEEVQTKDEIEAKIKAEAEYDAYEEGKLDRSWYDAEEGATMHDIQGDDDPQKLAELEEKKKRQAAQVARVNVRAKQRNEANEMWELNRLGSAGLAERKEHSLDYTNDEDEKRVVVMVRDTTPPFLDGSYIYTSQTEPVCPVKDPTSDMAVVAKQGSKVVKQVMEEQDQGKFRQRFWEIQGSSLGQAIGVKDKEKTSADDDVSDDDFNHRSNAQYGDLLKSQKVEASTEFGKTKTIAEQRRCLPVYKVREELLDLVREHQILIIVGETGSGKTTQLTQYLHEAGYTVNGQIGCTQPRRVAAVSVAKRVADEMDCELGTKVGYAIRFEDVTNDQTIIKYMTDGVLLRESLLEADLDKYSAVIMDEAHERSLNTDVLFGILRQVVARRNDFKLIVTSATMDAEKFGDFFGKAAAQGFVFVWRRCGCTVHPPPRSYTRCGARHGPSRL
eukprot:TRINITY_DN3873_c1_g1_i2.p1 TRINITY_DN3873_c1_g1~~TRINITY_DN3873_c1_g1_i2.p1  ORF type:complete len:737 (-),score=192.40 TRINITY_DN3873_c1_g1_i2:1309-3519(-)